MSTSVGDPFPLASYTLPSGYSRQPGPSKLSNVYASHLSASTDGYVTASAQGDGVHILDVSTLHAAVSHTLGPTSSFTCAAVSRIVSEPHGRSFVTYAVLENTQGICPEERGRTVRMWTDAAPSESTSATPSQAVRSTVVPHKVSAISAPEELPDHVLFIGEKGELTVADKDLAAQRTQSPSDPSGRLSRAFVFGRRACSFVPARSAFKDGAVVVMVQSYADGQRISVFGAGATETTTLAECPIPIPKLDIVDITCSSSGFITLLCRNGEWHSIQLDSSDYTTLNLSPAAPRVTLRGLSFITNPDSPSNPLTEVAAISLGSSHVLLSSVTTGSSPDLALLIWDLQYGVLLASRLVPIPTSVSRHKKHGIELQLTGAPGPTQQALFILTPQAPSLAVNGASSTQPSSDGARVSIVLVVPLSVPATSTVANALGRASDSERWLNIAMSKPSGGAAPSSNSDVDQTKCLKAMRLAMEQKRVEAADEAFFSWASQTEGRNANASANKSPYGYEFVKQALKIILRQPKAGNADIPYSPKVIRHLLEKKCISSNMVTGGLFSALRLRKDWDSLSLALKSVIDIPEDDLMWLLNTSVTEHHRHSTVTNDDAMQVDTASDPNIPSLQQVLLQCVTYPTSAAALRLAIRRQIPDASALMSILVVLAGWLQAHCDDEPQLLPEKTKKDAHGALIPVYEETKKDPLPPLDKVFTFIQALLDSSFLSLLSYAPSYKVLRQIMSSLEPEVSFIEDIEQLRAPLEPFVKTHTKMIHEAAHGPEKPDPGVDWRKRRKETHEQAAIAIGVYQVEELVL